ncbi:MAG: response regulator [Lachnospiraceae bacterium]|nr:response regulator [Lachnospiraceae bacterium]
MNLLVANGILRDYGMIVTTALSGAEAIELCKEQDFDLIFMDHMMPEMDGIEAMKRIRANAAREGKEARIIALTANAVSKAREMFLKEGFDVFVSKPIEIVDLERVMRRVLPRSVIEAAQEMDNAQNQEVFDDIRPAQDIKTETAYADAESADGMSQLLALLRGQGISTDKGMRYCQNDPEFYKTVLLQYAGDAEDKIQDMCRFFDEKDWANYKIRVHALKSSSKIIGAEQLSELAFRLETAAKQSREEEILAHHDELIARYHSIAEAVLHASGGRSDAQEDMELSDLTVQEFRLALKEISDNLEIFETEQAQEQIKKLSGCTLDGDKLEDKLKKLLEAVVNFELEEAKKEIASLQKAIFGGK